MIEAARSLESGGADFIVLCTNTMHKVAEDIQAHTHIPLLHIADATAQVIKDSGLGRVGLLGTRFTMEEDFYKNRLIQKYGLEVIFSVISFSVVVVVFCAGAADDDDSCCCARAAFPPATRRRTRSAASCFFGRS